ncbi:asparagine synthase C-terminal domain-containing protein [Streptomyces sp. TRM70350]|uniref:asparagine synthase-related protein n=1 Tax=Streptomyces sp. TRM70350 TaxID=2856165 RepID=UPI001C4762E3|nr:asparagine synthase C-terminal domain-containing protein [Streptomyces sp. TRM70350]MBV7696809.1 hypothetical protein [Streptomyces sp. TRM70350]
MRTYLAIAALALHDQIPQHVLDAAHSAAFEAIPAPKREICSTQWISGDRGVALLAWSNEPEHELLPKPLIGSGTLALGYCGYLGKPAVDERRLVTTDNLGTVTESLGGCFSVFRARESGIEAATSISRVCPVYCADAGETYLMGSRALLVHLVARAAATGMMRPTVDLDILALQPMVRHGFFANDETPFRGVRALPAAAVLTVRRSEGVHLRKSPMPTAEPAPTNAKRARERVEGLAEALIRAAAPIARHGEPVRLALSGGRDSRLMAAVLKAAKVPMVATTHGFADDPDVVLATRIAKRLGIEHRVSLAVTGEKKEAIVVTHPFLRTYDIIRMCEGMTSAYEEVNRWAPYEMTPRTSGSGGETLRGGFLYNQDDTSPAGIQKRVRKIFMAAEAFLTRRANERALEDYRTWSERAQTDGFNVLDQLYLFYRSGRWLVGAHTATLMNSPYYHPFLDNQVVREALALPADWRWSEEVVYRLIQTLAPEIAGIPPEGKRWRFESDRPRHLIEWPAWLRRAAFVPNGRTSGFNWRKSFDEAFLALLRDEVMNTPNELFDIVDKAKIKEHFDTVPKAWSNQVWHVYTLAVLLTGAWREARPDLPPVRIPIP